MSELKELLVAIVFLGLLTGIGLIVLKCLEVIGC